MRLLLGLGIFLVGGLFGSLCMWKAQQHRKDADKLFYLGSVAPSGRKYVWGALVAWLLV